MPTKLAACVACACAFLLAASAALAQDQAPKVTLGKSPVLQSIPDAKYKMGGEIGRRLSAVTEQWIIPAPQVNPGMLEMFRNRDRKPFVSPEGWAGEYAGKYLTHSVQVYKLTHDKRLREHLASSVSELVSLQAPDGYLGPWPKEGRLKPGPWDTWGHYHIMIGLLLWHEQTQDAKALDCARKIADMLCNHFLNTKERIVELGACEMNMAPIHSLCLLYEKTGEKKYLDLALEIEKEFTEAGDYVRTALDGKEYWQCPRPRWESLHPIMGIAELYFITGQEKYRQAYEHIWWSIVKGDRHNNGGFSTGEAARGDPYMLGAIETCCTVAWMAMSVDMLRMSGDSRVADELELSMLNSGLGMMSPSGRWVTYDTPMDGMRWSSVQSIGWQGRPGTPELSCCAVNGPRAIAMTCEWALMRNSEGMVLNYYGPCEMESVLPGGNSIRLVQETDYPAGNKVALTVKPAKPQEFTLALRIPYWSRNTSVSVKGQAVKATAGQYLKLKRTWTAGDRVTIELDFSPHFWVQREARKVADWEAQWTLFGPIDGLSDAQMAQLEKQATSATSEIPKKLAYNIPNSPDMADIPELEKKEVARKSVVAKNGVMDLVRVVDGRSQPQLAYGFTEYQSPSDGTLRVYFNVIGGYAWYVNGKCIASGRQGQNPPASVRRERVDLPVHKGRNIIAFKIPWGREGWHFSAGLDVPFAPGVMVTSIYRGPILMTYDGRYNSMDADDLPVLEGKGLSSATVSFEKSPRPLVLCEFKGADGRPVRLVDFGTAGATGTTYVSWLKVHFAGPTSNDFTEANPLRSFRP